MPAYIYDGGEWVEGIIRVREADAWQTEDPDGWVRDGDAWVQFQPGDADLLAPENLAADVGDMFATITWTNPEQETTPTHVQYRMASVTEVWTELEYPATTVDFAWLSPETEYQFQARYIVRSEEDGTIELTGATATLFFTTLALSGPGTPAADPGGTGADTIIPWGNTGNPGPVGGPGCWWEYVVQTADFPASGAITWSDTAVTGSFDGDAGQLAINFIDEGLDCGGLARMKYRENCDGTPGDYAFGDAFIMVCDWAADCGGLPGSDFASAVPFSDALHAMPKVCVDAADPLNIEDAVTTTVYGKLDGFGGVGRWSGNDVIIAKDGLVGYRNIVAGKVGELALLTDADDFSCHVQAMLDDVPGGAGGSATDTTPLVRWGKNVAISAVRASASTYYARVSWQKAAGGGTTLTGTTALNLDEYNAIGVTFDNSTGEVLLYVNGVEDASTTGLALAISDSALGQDVELIGSSLTRHTKVAAWDRVLTPEEMGLAYQNTAPYVVTMESFVLGVDVTMGAAVDIDIPLPAGAAVGDLALLIPMNRLSVLKTRQDVTHPIGVLGDATQEYYEVINSGAWYFKVTNVSQVFEMCSLDSGSDYEYAVVLVRNVHENYPIDNFEHSTASTYVDSDETLHGGDQPITDLFFMGTTLAGSDFVYNDGTDTSTIDYIQESEIDAFPTVTGNAYKAIIAEQRNAEEHINTVTSRSDNVIRRAIWDSNGTDSTRVNFWVRLRGPGTDATNARPLLRECAAFRSSTSNQVQSFFNYEPGYGETLLYFVHESEPNDIREWTLEADNGGTGSTFSGIYSKKYSGESVEYAPGHAAAAREFMAVFSDCDVANAVWTVQEYAASAGPSRPSTTLTPANATDMIFIVAHADPSAPIPTITDDTGWNKVYEERISGQTTSVAFVGNADETGTVTLPAFDFGGYGWTYFICELRNAQTPQLEIRPHWPPARNDGTYDYIAWTTGVQQSVMKVVGGALTPTEGYAFSGGAGAGGYQVGAGGAGGDRATISSLPAMLNPVIVAPGGFTGSTTFPYSTMNGGTTWIQGATPTAVRGGLAQINGDDGGDHGGGTYVGGGNGGGTANGGGAGYSSNGGDAVNASPDVGGTGGTGFQNDFETGVNQGYCGGGGGGGPLAATAGTGTDGGGDASSSAPGASAGTRGGGGGAGKRDFGAGGGANGGQGGSGGLLLKIPEITPAVF